MCPVVLTVTCSGKINIFAQLFGVIVVCAFFSRAWLGIVGLCAAAGKYLLSGFVAHVLGNIWY